MVHNSVDLPDATFPTIAVIPGMILTDKSSSTGSEVVDQEMEAQSKDMRDPVGTDEDRRGANAIPG